MDRPGEDAQHHGQQAQGSLALSTEGGIYLAQEPAGWVCVCVCLGQRPLQHPPHPTPSPELSPGNQRP